MKLIVGLGNPGRRYEGTRHNVGFAVVTELAKRHARSKPTQKFQGEVVDVDLAGVRALLLLPQTFMNRSGQSVAQARDFYKVELTELLVVSDEFNLPLGQLRLRTQGSAGGQLGLKDIIQSLGSDAFCRLRVGIGPVPGGWDPSDFVLGRFAKEEKSEIEVSVARAADAAELWAREGPTAAMTRYNGDR